MYPTVGKSAAPTMATLPPKLQPVSVLNLAKTSDNMDQIEADRLLAAKLQNEFNTKDIQQPAKSEPSSECPVCGVSYPVASIEDHVNTHFTITKFGEQANVTLTDNSKDESTGTLWNRIFGAKKTDDKDQKKDKTTPKQPAAAPKSTNPPINPLYPGFSGTTYAPMTTPQYRYPPGTTATLTGYPGYPVTGSPIYYYSNPATN